VVHETVGLISLHILSSFDTKVLNSRNSWSNYRKTHKIPPKSLPPTGQKKILYSDVVHDCVKVHETAGFISVQMLSSL